MHSPTARPRPAALFALALCLVLVTTFLLLPYPTMQAIASRHAWLGNAWHAADTLRPGLDLSHAFAFLLVGAALRSALPQLPLAAALGLLVLFGAGTELAQAWAPGRSPQWGDFAADFAGASTGWLLAGLLPRLRRAA